MGGVSLGTKVVYSFTNVRIILSLKWIILNNGFSREKKNIMTRQWSRIHMPSTNPSRNLENNNKKYLNFNFYIGDAHYQQGLLSQKRPCSPRRRPSQKNIYRWQIPKSKKSDKRAFLKWGSRTDK
jgi:hypothetical protein